jgi:hypothetical protein
VVLKNFRLAAGEIILRQFRDLPEKPASFFVIKIFTGKGFGGSGQSLEDITGKASVAC